MYSKLCIVFYLCGISLLSALEKPIDFNRQILPILSDNCFDCHGPDKESRKAKLRLDTKEGLFSQIDFDKAKKGDLEASPLLERILTDDEDDVMPPSDSHRTLSDKQINLFKQWLKEGAEYEEHWSFSLPEKITIPHVESSEWIQNDIDKFVLSKLKSSGLKPQRKADPEVLLRRVHLLLNGLPPSEKELDDFIADYRKRGQKALSEKVDNLMTRAAYGEHMAWTWMDAARYADTNGYQADNARIMWRWRDWLVKALNKNLTYDQLTIQMLAGDLLIPKLEQKWQSNDYISNENYSDLITATGFLRNHRYDAGSGTIAEESKFENAADRLETVGTVWMGMTMQCARCHDHKFDPLPTKDYYRMMAVFDKVSELGSAVTPNSHPYIVTPTAEQRTVCNAKLKVIEGLKSQIRNRQHELDQAKKGWVKSGANEVERVKRSRVFHFARFKGNVPDKAEDGAVIASQGLRGNTWKFDGKTRVKLSKDVSKVFSPSKSWTIAAWFKIDGNGKMGIMGSMEKPARDRTGIQVEVIDGYLRIRQICRWNHSAIEYLSKDKIEQGKWYHFAFSSDGRKQGIAYKAWLNGSQEDMKQTRGLTNDGNREGAKTPFYIGKLPYVGYLKGEVADINIYERNLDDEEVKLLSIPESLSEHTGEEKYRNAIDRFVYDELVSGELRKLITECYKAEEEFKTFLTTLPSTMVMDHDPERKTYVHPHGAYDKLGEEVEGGTLSAFTDPEEQEKPVDRLGFAKWLVSGKHPLTGRVAVNRLWTQLWGRGFVDSPENFGTQSAEPEHRDLLDFLALRFVGNGWNMKETLKYIVMSSTWQQSSAASEDLYLEDPQNIYLARGPRFRLPINIVRDQALHLSASLNLELGGEPVAIDKVIGKDDKVLKRAPLDKTRRSLYTYWVRNRLFPMFKSFDAADRTICSVRVRRTNTPLQALITLNESSLFESAKKVAQNIYLSDETNKEKLSSLYRKITARIPNSQQVDVLVEALQNYKLHFSKSTSETAALTGKAENVDLAAWATVANLIMNLDTTLTLE